VKRFTDTEKWNNPSFRSLPVPYKLLYLFLLDACDNAGVIHFDLERFEFALKEKFTIEGIKEHLGDKLHFFKDKIAVKNFIRYQCGELSPQSHPHKRVIELLMKHDLAEDYAKRVI
jgi:hypothetical protein